VFKNNVYNNSAESFPHRIYDLARTFYSFSHRGEIKKGIFY